MTHPAPHTGVRLALPTEAGAIAELQRKAWGALYSATDAEERWRAAISRPTLATQRVLVAVDAGLRGPVGFAVTGPSDDPDAEPTVGTIAELVAPRAAGHLDRLLHAAAETLRADGFTIATYWLRADDDETRAALAATGWATDGAYQEVGTEDGSIRVKLVRLVTTLAAEPELSGRGS